MRAARVFVLGGLSAVYLVAWIVLGGCQEERSTPAPGSEAERRVRLGIPDGAERVLVLGQNAHLDPGWQLTLRPDRTLVVTRPDGGTTETPPPSARSRPSDESDPPGRRRSAA